MATILGDPSEAEPLDTLPPPHRFTARLADLENLRGSISRYLSVVDQTETAAGPSAFRSILEDEDYGEQGEEEPQVESPEEQSVSLEPEVPASAPAVPRAYKAKPAYQRKRKTTKIASRRPQPPRRNFIKENIVNIHTVRKSASPLGPQGEEWTNRLLHRPKAVPAPPLVVKGILKPEAKAAPSETAEALRSRIEASKVVRNEGLLAALFEKVADSLALHWEEAAEMIIMDLLQDEAMRLTAMEEAPVPAEVNVNSLLEVVEQYNESADALRQKYCI